MATASAPPVMRVGIEEARGLLAGDMNGFSDPYVQLLLLDRHGDVVPGAPTIKTKIRIKTLNPKWAERFVIGDTGVDLRTVTTLRFVVYDWDGYKSDDTLGVVDVPIDDAFTLAEQGNEDWYRVNKLEKQMNKDAKGDLKLQFTRAIPEKLATESPTAVVVEDGSPNLLYVVIDSGKDLLAMDPNHSSDPFVKLSVTGQSFSTTAIEKTLKPHWDERFAFVVRDVHTTLELIVEDEDRTVNDFLGRAQVVLADVIEAEKEKKIDVKLLNKKLQEDKDRGTLHLRVLWTFDENAESIATSMKKRKKQEQSIFHQLTARLHLTVPDVQVDEEKLISHLNEQQGILDDESDDEDKLPLPPGAKTVRFASITIHRAEELPPLDALHFEKEKHKASAPGGGIDAYVAAWVSSVPEDYIRTRIHTRKGRRDELSTSFHETLMLALPTGKTPTDITLAVMDWDSVGGDEVVSHVELKDVEELILSKEGKPFWWNLYGAPLVGVKSKGAVDKMNKDTTAGSTYRGRILLTLKLTEKPATAYDERHQKRAAKKLPRTLFPPSGVYRLRAHFLTAIGLPEPTDKYYLSLSCGTHEITSTQKAAISRAVEWNETEESDRLVFPLDASQIPDIVLSLCTGEWEKRVIVSYMRFKAGDLLAKEFNNTTVEWVPLRDDPTSEVIKKNEFPGKVLLRLGFGSLAAANVQVWDQKSMIDIVNRRVPYQIRVRLQGLKNVAKAGSVDAARKTPVHVRVQCADQESQKSNVVLRVSEAPAVFTLDVNLPQLSHASQVLIHLQESEAKDAAFIGTLAVSLDEAKDLSGVDASGIVTRCTSEQLKKNTRPQAPRAEWLPLIALDDTIESNHLLASVEIIRKMYPDEKLPTAEPEALESP